MKQHRCTTSATTHVGWLADVRSQKTWVLAPGDASHQSIKSILMYTQSSHDLQSKQILWVKSQSNRLWAAISYLCCELWAKRSDLTDIQWKRNKGDKTKLKKPAAHIFVVFELRFPGGRFKRGKAIQFVPSHSRTLTTRRSLATLPTVAAPWHNRSTGKKPSIDKLKGFISLAIVAGNTLIHRLTLPQTPSLRYTRTIVPTTSLAELLAW